MITDQLVKNPGAWLTSGRQSGVVISSRLRLARNVKGYSFPGWAPENERVVLFHELCNALAASGAVPDSLVFEMGALEDVDRDVLQERHLISNELAQRGAGSGLVVSPDEHVSVMLNEEDHIRLQVITPGLNLRQAWTRAKAMDTRLEAHVDYAFSPELGYLTSCPSNVGTGLRASVMLHLPGLCLTADIDGVIRGLEKLGMAVRGLSGEGSEAAGHMFQVSNQLTLGVTEDEIIAQLSDMVNELVSHEHNARARLDEGKRSVLLDHVGRSFGVLMYAQLLSSREVVDLLSGIKLGIETGLVKRLSLARLNEIILLTQPGHLQKIIGKTVSSEERDQIRARLVRQKVKGLSLDV